MKLSNLPKRPTFSQILEGLNNCDFYYSKFYNFFIERATGGLFDYYSIVSKEEKQKNKKKIYFAVSSKV